MFILKVRWEVARSGAQPLAPSGNGLLGFFWGGGEVVVVVVVAGRGRGGYVL